MINGSNCSRCGTRNERNANFCVNCGALINFQESDVSEDIVRFIGYHWEFYVRKFSGMKTNKRIISWNWAAFFFSSIWLIFRKRYGLDIVLLILQFSTQYYFKFPFLGTASMWITGLFGNYYYMGYVKKEICKVKTLPEIEKNAQYAYKGGTNVVAALIIGVLFLLFSVFAEIAEVIN